MAQWRVIGATRETADDATVVVEAPTAAAAEILANRMGLMVERVELVDDAQRDSSRVERVRAATPAPPTLPMPATRPTQDDVFAVKPEAPVIVTTQRTAKIWKLIILISLCVFLSGFPLSCMSSANAMSAGLNDETTVATIWAALFWVGIIMILGGFLGAVVGKICAYWHHG